MIYDNNNILEAFSHYGGTSDMEHLRLTEKREKRIYKSKKNIYTMVDSAVINEKKT